VRLSTKIPLVTALMVSLTTVAVSATTLSISYNQGIDALDGQLKDFKASLVGDPDPLSAAVFLASEKPFTLIYQQQDGTRTILQEKAGLVESGQLKTVSIDLGYGEELVIGVSTKALDDLVEDSLPPVIWFAILLLLLGSLSSWLVLRRDTAALRALAKSAQLADATKPFSLPNPSNTHELLDLSKSLNQLLGRLQASRVELEDFLSDTSHELKTPLTVIRGYLEILNTSQDAAARDRAIASAYRETLRMQRIVGGLLELSEISAGSINTIAEFDPVELIEIEIDSLRTIQPDRKVELTIGHVGLLQTDPNAFRTLVSNVFSNIRIHTPSDSPIEVSIQKVEAGIQFVIRDFGPGIPQTLLVDPGDSPIRFRGSNKSESSGLGMSIMHKAALAIGARLEIENLGDGTQVTITV